nr:hypothetical protein [Tanacetum cinerariifolium]
MSAPKFAETHNLVAFLEKPIESEGFEQIIDFLNANPIKYALKEVSTADPVPTAGEVVTTNGVETSKPKAQEIVIQEPSETPTSTPIDSSQQSSKAKDKGKAKMIKPKKPMKRKDQIMIDKEVAKNFEAQISIKKGEKAFSNSSEQMSIVKARFQKTKPVDGMDNLLFQTLKIMLEHHVDDNIWKYQQGIAKVLNWKLFYSCGVYCVTTQNMMYYLLVEKMYQFTRNVLHQMWNDVRLQVDYEVEMAYDLFRLIKRQISEGYVPE